MAQQSRLPAGTDVTDLVNGLDTNQALPPGTDVTSLINQAEPVASQPVSEPAATEPEVPLWERAYQSLMNAPEFITRPAGEFAQSMMPGEDTSFPRTKGFIGGAVEGAADLLSPVNLLTFGRGRLPSLAARVLGGTQIAHGAHEIATDDAAEGVGDIGFGLIDLATGFPKFGGAKLGRSVKPPEVKPLIEPKLAVPDEIAPKVDLPEQAVLPEQPRLPLDEADLSLTPEGLKSVGIEPAPRVDPIKKLNEALEKSVPLNKKQAEIYSEGLKEKLAKARGIKVTDLESHHLQKAKLAGKYEKVEIEPLSNYLDDVDMSGLIQKVEANPKLLDLEKVRTRDALEKLYNGQVPQPNEIDLLVGTFGDELMPALVKMSAKSANAPGLYTKTQDFMRAMLTSGPMEFSAFMRQGRGFITRPEYWKNIPTAFKARFSDDFYKATMANIDAHPNFQRVQDSAGNLHPSLAERAGIDITNRRRAARTNREELYRSRLAEKFPFVKSSERAYLGFLNKLRADVFNSTVDLAKRNGKNPEVDDVLLKQIGDLINDVTGRGSLGSLEKHAGLLNAAIFAPKLHMGRLRLWGRVFNPKFYTQTDPMVRKEALRSLISSTSLGLMLGELARMGGAQVSNDPTNADFRKIKIGDTRIDPFSGDQQYGVAMARALTGTTTSSTSGRTTNLWSGRYGQQTTGDMALNFIMNRAAPIPRLAYTLMFDQRFGRETIPEHIREELIRSVTPIMLQDMYDIAQEDPELLPYGAPLSAIGIGVQTYGR